MSRKYQALGLLFLSIMVLGLFTLPVSPVTTQESQTREIGLGNQPLINGGQVRSLTSITDLTLSSGVSVNYGTPTNTYQETWASDNDYHVWASASYVESGEVNKLATGVPTYTYGTSTSGTYVKTQASDNDYHISTSSSYDGNSTNTGVVYPTAGANLDTVGTRAWSNPTNIYADDGAYASATGVASSTVYTNYLRSYTYSFSLASNSVVEGIKLEIKRVELNILGKHCYDEYVYLYITTTKGSNYAATETAYPTTEAYASYGGTTNLWGTTWTYSDVNSANFGAVLCTQIDSSASIQMPYVNCMRITVYYHLTYYRIDFYYSFQFTEYPRADVTSLSWNAEGKVSAGTLAIYIYNYVTPAWVDTTQAWTTAEATKSASVSKDTYMDASGNMRIRLYLTGASASFTVSADYLYWHVDYSATRYRIDSTYSFQSTTVKDAVTGLIWSAEGKTSSPAVAIYIYNYITSLWVDTGQTWTSSEATKSGSVSPDYMDSNSYTKTRFYLVGQTSSFTISVDYLKWEVIYTYGVGSTEYCKATGAPAYTYGSSSSGTYEDTWTSNDAYHISACDASYNLVTSPQKLSTTVTSVAYGTQVWNNPTYSMAKDGLSANAHSTGTNQASYMLQNSGFGFSIPTGADVKGVVLIANCKASGSTHDTWITLLYGGSSVGYNYAIYSWGGAYVNLTWGSPADMWGYEWTPAKINDSGFGSCIAVVLVSSGIDAYVDYVVITVYYNSLWRIDYNYSFQAVNTSYARVNNLMWTAEGKTSSPTIGIYLYDFSSSSWGSTGQSWTPTEATKYQVVDKTHYMHTNGSMRIRLYATAITSSFTVSADFLKWDVSVAVGSPSFLYPLNNSVIGTATPTTTWSEVAGVSPLVYQLQISSVSDFASLLTNVTTGGTSYTTSALTAGLKYARLRTVDGLGNVGDWSGTLIFTVDNIAPAQVDLFYPLNDQAIDGDTLLVWNSTTDSGSGIDYYRVQLSTDNFATTSYDLTTNRTWYQFNYGVLAFVEWYWRVCAVDKLGNQGDWSTIRHFYQTADPQVNVVLRDANNPAINEYINLAAFNITYHRSIQDGAGIWYSLSPYMPVINMYSSEAVNITVRDWMGNYILNNQRYSYAPTILVDLDVWDVCVGNGADAMAYVILRSGNVFLHRFTYRSDLHWLVIAGNYNLTVIYPAVGNAQVYYNLTISGDFGIKISSNMIADLYSAADNWESLTGNVANIVTKIKGVETEIYSWDTTQVQMKEAIQDASYQIGRKIGDVEEAQNILNWIIVMFAIAVVIALVSIWGRAGAKQTQEDLDHFRGVTNATDRQVEVALAEIKKKEQGG